MTEVVVIDASRHVPVRYGKPGVTDAPLAPGKRQRGKCVDAGGPLRAPADQPCLKHPLSAEEGGQMPPVPFQDVIDALEYVGGPDVLQKAKGNIALWHALEMSRPSNWRGTGIKPEGILTVAKETGVPVAWVPPPDVLKRLASAAPSGRQAVIRSHVAEIIAQCDQLLSECRDNWLGDERVLVGRAWSRRSDRLRGQDRRELQSHR
jgi:hypothetical protein